jgi:putative Mn2+ efflux pump MntP
MIKESLDKEEGDGKDNKFNLKYVLILSVATSIDALAVGVTFAFLQVNILHAVTLIGLTTFILSFLGVKIGNVFGCKYKSKAEFFGGCVLIIMGFKILIDHCGVFEKFL